jgi:hypothetical protein
MVKRLLEALRSIDCVAFLSSAIVVLAATTIAVAENIEAAEDWRNASVPGPTIIETAIFATLTWIAVSLRFPFLSAVFAIGVAMPDLRTFAANGVIVCSHSLLMRTRFFDQRGADPKGRLSGSACGWLATLSVLEYGIARDYSGHSLSRIALLPSAAALCVGIVAAWQARRTAANAWRTLVVSFFAGVAACLTGMVLTLAALFIVSLSDIGNSGSSRRGAWQSKPVLVQPSAAPGASNEQR